jgi:arginyl-tRNA synthetase
VLFRSSLFVTILFLTFYAGGLTDDSRKTSAALKIAEDLLVNEKNLSSLDGLAAAAAHHLGTPLGTISLIANELKNEIDMPDSAKKDLIILSDEVEKVLKYNEEWGKKKLKKERVLVEFVSSNPTGPLHIGHARGAVLGNIISNLLSNQGYEVTKEYYVNDAGRQINILALSIMLETFQNNINKEGLYQGDYIKDLAKKFMAAKLVNEVNNPLEKFSDDPDERIDQLISHYKKDSPETWNLIRDFSVNEMIKLIKDDLSRMEILHDEWFYESSLGSIEKKDSSVAKALDEIVKSKNTFEKDGAIWFEGTKYGDDKDRVLLRANKEPTYYLTDVGYHKDKIDRNYDHYINIFGADHHGYVTRLTSAFNLIKKPKQNIEHILYQLVNLYEE